MHKMFMLGLVCVFASRLAYADGHHHGHHHDHHSIEYYAVPQPVYAVPAPMPPPPVRYYDQRSAGGMLGGILGAGAGYQIGNGDPLGAGIGAAAGAWMGNSLSR